jgi:hypothetical protein
MAGNTEERGKTKPRICPRRLPQRSRHHHNGENENAHPLIDVGAFGCDPTKNGRPSGGRHSVKRTAVCDTSFALVTIQIDLFLGLYRDSSADLKPLQWISPDNARSQPLGPVGRVCSSLLRCAVENQLEGAGNIDLVTGQNELYILLSIIYRGNEYPIILCWDTKKICY